MKFLLSAAIALAGIAAFAPEAAASVNKKTAIELMKDSQFCPEGMTATVQGDLMQYTFIPEERKPAKSAETFTVTVKGSSENADFKPDMAYLFNSEFKDTNFFPSMGMDAEFTVEPGVYNVMLSYKNNPNARVYYVIRENVEVNSDMTLELLPEEATERVRFLISNRDGQLWQIPYFTSTGGYDLGNAQLMCITSLMMYEGIGNLTGSGFVMDQQISDDYNNMSDFFVSSVSDKFLFHQVRLTMGNDNIIYLNNIGCRGTENPEVRNNPEDYKLYSEKFVVDKSAIDEYYFTCKETDTWNGQYLTGWNTVNNWGTCGIDENPKFYVDSQDSNEGDGFDYMAYLRPAKSTVVYMEGDGSIAFENPGYYACAVVAPSVIVNGDKDVYKYFVDDRCGNYTGCNYDIYEGVPYTTGHPLFSYDSESKHMDFGNSTPLLWFQNVNIQGYDGILKLMIDPYYIGRLCESMQPSQYAMKTSVTRNGVDLDIDNYAKLANMNANVINAENDKGLFCVKMQSVKENPIEPGIISSNTATVEYDSNKEDFSAPVFSMLQFRDVNGNITDNFNNAADGIFYLSGGDFNYVAETWKVSLQPIEDVDVEVYAAPYGSEEWKSLPIEQMPEYTYGNNGYSWKGNIAEAVADNTYSGWYDMRLKITDKAGNYCDQVVSPAFKINETVGVDGIVDDNMNYTPEVYTIDGLRIETATDALPAGFYIINGRKVVVR